MNENRIQMLRNGSPPTIPIAPHNGSLSPPTSLATQPNPAGQLTIDQQTQQLAIQQMQAQMQLQIAQAMAVMPTVSLCQNFALQSGQIQNQLADAFSQSPGQYFSDTMKMTIKVRKVKR